MKIIILKDTANLGRAGDVKTVADGFAQNFLMPRGLAEPATAASLANLETRRALLDKTRAKEEANYRKIAEQLASEPLIIPVKIGEHGKAFGSVTTKDITDAFANRGIELKKDWLDIQGPIKTTGEHLVKIKFPHQITGEVKIIVEPEK